MEGVKRNPDVSIDDLQSEFDYESEIERKKKRTDFLEKDRPGEIPLPGRSEGRDVFQEEHRRYTRQISRLWTMDAYSRHKEMINLYHLCYQGSTALLQRDTSTDKTDYDVLKNTHKFLWTPEDDLKVATSWEHRMAKKYYDKLFKEYCIVDLTFYEKNKVGMRWRIEKEVKSGKGQFICGNKKCNETEKLTSWEVNFAYMENGERKNALVKARLCPVCSEKLNYGSQKKKVVKKKRTDKKKSVELKTEVKKEKEEEVESNEKSGDANSAAKEGTSSDVWLQPAAVETERTVDEDIDDFLDQLFE